MNKTIERLITSGMIAVLATAFIQVAHAENELAPFPDKSSAYNAGYSQG